MNGDDHTLPTPPLPQPRRSIYLDRPAALARLDQAMAAGKQLVVLTNSLEAGTNVALRWAHEHQHLFPDGQLHANLGICWGTEPPSSSAIVSGWLRALGDTRSEMPDDLDTLAADLQRQHSDKRLLFVLVDAISVAQVRNLRMTGPSIVTLVTTPWLLGGLDLEGAEFIRVER